jgi:hypothetical protein
MNPPPSGQRRADFGGAEEFKMTQGVPTVPDPFRGAFADGSSRDPAHRWYQKKPMPADRLAQVLTDILKEKGVTGYDVSVTAVAQLGLSDSVQATVTDSLQITMRDAAGNIVTKENL